jgi:hypothetical protein
VNEKEFRLFKKIYKEINLGYSFVKEKNVYIKHFRDIDFPDVDNVYEQAVDKAKKLNLPSLEEKEKELIDNDLWSKKENQEVNLLKNDIENLEKRKNKMFIKSQIDKIKKDISEKQKKLHLLEKTKNELLGLYAEAYANKQLNDYFIINSFYYDASFKNKLNIEEFEYNEDMIGWIILYNRYTNNFNKSNIKKIAISPMFLNTFMLCENNVYEFYGKPIVELSNFQIELSNYGKHYSNIFSNPEVEKLDEKIKNDPELLSDWYKSFINFKYNQGKNPSGKGMSFVMGAQAEDMKYLGNTSSNKDLNMIAGSKGGKLGIEDLAKL